MDVKAVIETTLKAEIVKALNAAPDAIEKLVNAAISAPVDKLTGSNDRGSWGEKVPYLDFLIGDEIRRAARDAVQEVFAANIDMVKAAVKAKFSTDSIVDAFAIALVETGRKDWNIKVQFEAEKSR